MLNGIDPIIIFEFSKKVEPTFVGPTEPSLLQRFSIVSHDPTVVAFPPIPIYLSETLTGLFIESEDKSIDIDTETETLTNGGTPDVNQKGISSVVTVNLVGKKNSIGLSLLSAMVDLLYEKVTSKEYTITYLHGATTVFRGLLHSYNVSQNAENDKLSIKFEISKGSKQPVKPPGVPAVVPSTGTIPVG